MFKHTYQLITLQYVFFQYSMNKGFYKFFLFNIYYYTMRGDETGTFWTIIAYQYQLIVVTETLFTTAGPSVPTVTDHMHMHSSNVPFVIYFGAFVYKPTAVSRWKNTWSFFTRRDCILRMFDQNPCPNILRTRHPDFVPPSPGHNIADGKHESRQNKLNSMWNGKQMPSLIIMLIFSVFRTHISLCCFAKTHLTFSAPIIQNHFVHKKWLHFVEWYYLETIITNRNC